MNYDDLILTEKQRAEQKRRAEERRAQIDCAMRVMELPEGRELLTGILRHAGVGGRLSADPARVAVYNFGMDIFGLLKTANGARALAMLADIHNLSNPGA